MEKSFILENLHKYIEEKRNKDKSKGTAKFLDKLESITESDVSFGEAPTLFYAYMTCNSTGVGESYYQGASTQRTVSKNYTTDENLFFEGHMGAAKYGVGLFIARPDETVKFFNKNDMEIVADSYGYKLHSQDFSDLNIRCTSHRVNRYNVHVTKGPFTLPVRPVFGNHRDKKDEIQQILLGYLYEKDGVEYIIIEPGNTKTASGEKKSGCAPWMFLGLLCPPILLVALYVLLFKREE